MRIKHFCGYGSVNAVKVKDPTCTLHVRVSGNHERGVVREPWDTPLLYKWLIKRFDKKAPDEITWSRRVQGISDPLKDYGIQVIPGYDFEKHEDTCDYLFTY